MLVYPFYGGIQPRKLRKNEILKERKAERKKERKIDR